MTLLWVDTETSGLNAVTNLLLEVGIAATDSNLEKINSISVPIKHPTISVDEIYESSPPLIQEMHSKSKLWDAIRSNGCTLEIAEEILLRFAQKYTEQNESPMCGSTVSFDRGFLRAYMPTLEGWFHYRNIDVSTVKELANRWNNHVWLNRPDEKDKAHRALADLDHSIAELKYYKRTFLINN